MKRLVPVHGISKEVRCTLLTLLIFSLCILPSSLFALTMVPSTLHKLSQEADWIILATPSHKTTIKIKHRLVTRYTLTPHAYLKMYTEPNQSSSRPSQLFFDFLGGTLDEVSQTVPGLTSPPLDRPLLLFLKCVSATQCRPLGWNQGTWGLSSHLNPPSIQDLLTEPYLFKPLLDSHDLHWVTSSKKVDRPTSSLSTSSLSMSSTSTSASTSASTSSSLLTSNRSTQLHTPLSRISPLSLSTLANLVHQKWVVP